MVKLEVILSDNKKPPLHDTITVQITASLLIAVDAVDVVVEGDVFIVFVDVVVVVGVVFIVAVVDVDVGVVDLLESTDKDEDDE